jgi:exodeoxyribonuclease V beta subunit
MEQLMLECHYPLQAHLYLVALHRYLRWRLPGFAPEQHLGGYGYVFLRGVPGPLTPPGAESGPVVAGQGERRLVDSSQVEDVPGMFLERPPLGRVLALEALFAGEPAQERR